MGSDSKFLIYFGDKNGKLGKTLFKEKRYCGYIHVDKFKVTLKEIDNCVDIWQKKDYTFILDYSKIGWTT